MHSAGRRMNLDVVDNRDVTKRIPLQRMRYSEVQQKLRYQRMGTGFGSGGVMIIPITVWANKAVLAKAATRDRSATMAAGGGYPRIYINGRLEKGDTQNRRKERMSITINRPSRRGRRVSRAFGSFLRQWRAKKRLRLSAWRRGLGITTEWRRRSDQHQDKGKEGPEGGEKRAPWTESRSK